MNVGPLRKNWIIQNDILKISTERETKKPKKSEILGLKKK